MATSVPCKNQRVANSELNIEVKPISECGTDALREASSLGEDLVPDVLAIIFSYLDLPDRGRAGQVCQAWRYVFNHPSSLCQVTAEINPEDMSSELLQVLVKRGIQRVKLSCPNNCSKCTTVYLDNALQILTGGLPRLSSLEIDCKRIKNEIMSDVLLEKMPQLTHLKLTFFEFISNACVERICQKLTNLVTLSLETCPLLTHTEVRSIVNRLGALKDFRIFCCRQLADESIKYMAGLDQQLVHKPNLKTLNLYRCGGLTDQSLLYLSQGQKNLKILKLVGLGRLTDDGLAHLVHLPYLEKLVLKDCISLSGRGMIHIAKMANLRKFHAAYRIGDLGLAFLAEGGSKIDTLDLSCSNGDIITSSGASHLSRLIHLRNLKLSRSSSVTDYGLMFLAKMTSLKKLSIQNCKVTDDSLAHLPDGGSKITCLELNSCYLITDLGLGHLSRMTRLEEIVINNCISTTEVGLTNLASGRAKITKLNLLYFPSYIPSDEGSLGKIAKGLFPMLHELKINGDGIDDEWLKLAAKNLPHLHTQNDGYKNIIGKVRKFREGSGI